VITVKRLPKTRSGKILRGTMRKIADGEAWKMPATIDDPAILDEIAALPVHLAPLAFLEATHDLTWPLFWMVVTIGYCDPGPSRMLRSVTATASSAMAMEGAAITAARALRPQ
jgi:hypothetical protein